MATEREYDASISALLSGIVGDAQHLVRQEIALARQEIREEIAAAKEAGTAMAIAGTIGKPCKAMEGLFTEGEEMIKEKADPAVRDAGLIAAAQRVEHYEIAAYGCARIYARQLGQQQVANLLQQTLDEEGRPTKN